MSVLDKFFYQIKGPATAKKWVFVHGLMGFSSNWLKIISSLQESESCLVFDQRGHGRSFHPQTGYSPRDYAQDILEITQALDWQRFVLVGHSMGGRNSLIFASEHPEKVEKLILEDIGPDSDPKAQEYYENLLNLVPLSFPDRDAARKFFREDFIEKAHTHEDVSKISQFFYANMTENEDATMSWRFSRSGVIASVSEAKDINYWKILQELKVPTMIVRGANSPEFSQTSYNKVITCNPLIQGVEIPNAGHWVHIDQPRVFTDVLKDFVGVGKTTLDF